VLLYARSAVLRKISPPNNVLRSSTLNRFPHTHISHMSNTQCQAINIHLRRSSLRGRMSSPHLPHIRVLSPLIGLISYVPSGISMPQQRLKPHRIRTKSISRMSTTRDFAPGLTTKAIKWRGALRRAGRLTVMPTVLRRNSCLTRVSITRPRWKG
jgi:hypothetical protein